jgi:hypothetical protein
MKFGDHLHWQDLGEAGSEQVSEQVMVAEPPVFVVQGDDEGVRPVEGCQSGLPITATRNSLTQPGIQAFKD